MIEQIYRGDWRPFNHYGLTHYRIWFKETEFGVFQRHEWKNEDGAARLEDWVKSPLHPSTLPAPFENVTVQRPALYEPAIDGPIPNDPKKLSRYLSKNRERAEARAKMYGYAGPQEEDT